MKDRSNLWSLILAGGDGTRLQALTQRVAGAPIPKQYCRLLGRRSLLEATLDRVAALAPPARTVTVVNESHLPLATAQLDQMPAESVLVQPGNRDTGPGMVFSLVCIARRSPRARVAVFPSDHYVADESAFRSDVRRAFRLLDRRPEKVVLLGIEPEEADPTLGYIEPGGAVDGGEPRAFHVAGFQEKPSLEVAHELHRRGGLWNSFVMVFDVERMLELVRRERPDDVARIEALEAPTREQYGDLPAWNFSSGFLSRVAEELLVLRSENTGWSDWGTPEAIERTMLRDGLVPSWMGAEAAA